MIRRLPGAWRLLVPCIALAAGVLLSTSAETSQGTDLRGGRRVQLEQLIADRGATVGHLDARLRTLRRAVDQATASASRQDRGVAAVQSRVTLLAPSAGLTALRGPGLVVTLNDVPRRTDGSLPAGAVPDDVVVHQQDVQAVVNALWSGGAEAMTIMGQRVVATSAVRCVGNTLLLQGRTYSPPFVVAAIGKPQTMRVRLDAEPGVRLFRQYVDAFGLGYAVVVRTELRMPAYEGSLALSHARPAA